MGFWEFKGLAGVGSYYGLEIEEKRIFAQSKMSENEFLRDLAL